MDEALQGLNIDTCESNRVNRFDQFRARLRKAAATDDIRRGPLVAKHPLPSRSSSPDILLETEVLRPRNTWIKRCHTPPPRWLPEAPTSPRRLSPSLVPSRAPSPNTHVSRPASPNLIDPAVMEMVQRRVRRVQKARLYLLHQPGPNSFVVGGDSPEHKYRVVIGPQTCSCGRGPHCLHLLFIMLRVFQVPENDMKIFAKELKNFEVESLFQQYQERRILRVKRRQEDYKKKFKDGCGDLYMDIQENAWRIFEFPLPAETKLLEEEICPICLLEMIDGESLVECVSGCHNKLHHHCMAIWASECVRQGEAVLCPLCRHHWPEKKYPHPQGHQVSLSQEHQHRRVKLSKRTVKTSSMNMKLGETTGPVPMEHMSIASDWMKILGPDVMSSLYSQDWKDRESALKQIQSEISNIKHSENEELFQRVIWSCAKIVNVLVADPVFKVFAACVHCFRTVINHFHCETTSQLKEFLELIRPTIRTLLKKCADRNRRTSHLSAEVLAEVAKNEIGIQVKSKSASVSRMNGLDLVLSCILEHFTVDSVSWQWLAGRLLMLNTLFQLLPDEFRLNYVSVKGSDAGYKLNNFDRLFSIIEFSFKALHSSHSTVIKVAKDVFILASSMTVKERGILNQILEMLSVLNSSMQAGLRKRLVDAIECHNQAAYGADNMKLGSPINVKVVNLGNAKNKPGAPNPIPNFQSKSVVSPPVVRPKDLALDLNQFRGNKQVKLQGRSNAISPSSPSKRWINSSSKLSNLFSRTKKQEETLVNKIEFSESFTQTCDSVCFCETSSTMRGANLNNCSKSLKIENATLFTKDATCAPTIASEGYQTAESQKVFIPVQEIRTAADGDDQRNVPDEIPTESHHLWRSLESEIYSYGMKTKLYVEDVNWKRGPALGSGAYSTCFQARDIASGTLMAVKQVSFLRNSRQEQERVESEIWKEIIMLSKLNHPNVLQMHGATKQDGHFNIFVEWMAGGSVSALLDSYGPFQEEVIMNYTKQILEGLQYLHQNHILHRDLKGANLLIDSTGRHLRIGDFGAAARLENQATISGEFQGQLLGTIAFMAPEVLRGEDYGRSCDIWSVGCCIIEMATAKPPWKENQMSNHLALMYKIASSKDPPFVPNTLGTLLKDVAYRCLQIIADLRPTANELLGHKCFQFEKDYILPNSY